MKLRNKKTGEIRDVKNIIIDGLFSVSSIDELNEEWEDYEESKGYWFINEFGTPTEITHTRENIYDKCRKNFGNYFESKEAAEQAVEIVKALTRLKDKGLRFMHNKVIGEYGNVSYTLNYPVTAVEEKDLNLLFGDEE